MPSGDILIQVGCDELQGYLFAKPMSARALLLWASDDRERATAFKPSLFGQTRPLTDDDSLGGAYGGASTALASSRVSVLPVNVAFADTLRNRGVGV